MTGNTVRDLRKMLDKFLGPDTTIVMFRDGEMLNPWSGTAHMAEITTADSEMNGDLEGMEGDSILCLSGDY